MVLVTKIWRVISCLSSQQWALIFVLSCCIASAEVGIFFLVHQSIELLELPYVWLAIMFSIRLGFQLLFVWVQSRFSFGAQSRFIETLFRDLSKGSTTYSGFTEKDLSELVNVTYYQITHRGILLAGTLILDSLILVSLTIYLIYLFPLMSLVFFASLGGSVFLFIAWQRCVMSRLSQLLSDVNIEILSALNWVFLRRGIGQANAGLSRKRDELRKATGRLESLWSRSNVAEQSIRLLIEYFGFVSLGVVLIFGEIFLNSEDLGLIAGSFGYLAFRLLPVGNRLNNSIQGVIFAGELLKRDLGVNSAIPELTVDIANKLNQKVREGLTLIKGPSGVGKTTSVEAWIRSLGMDEEVSYLPQGVGFDMHDLDLLNSLHYVPNKAESSLFKNLEPSAFSLSNSSGGEAQRIGLLATLRTPGSFLVFDEPLSALDSETADYAVDAILEIAKRYRVIVVSHDQKFDSHASNLITL